MCNPGHRRFTTVFSILFTRRVTFTCIYVCVKTYNDIESPGIGPEEADQMKELVEKYISNGICQTSKV